MLKSWRGKLVKGLRDLADIELQLSEGIRSLAIRRLIHGDLKASNLIIDISQPIKSTRVKIIDCI